MFSHDDSPQFGRFEHGIIRRKARQLVGQAGFTRQDMDDLVQELFMRLLQGARQFDPALAHWKSFVTTVVERGVCTILRNANARKRDRRRVVSLNDTEADLDQLIGDRAYNARRRSDPRAGLELSQLTADLNEILKSFPDHERDLARRLQHQSIAAIARETGIPRTTLHDAVRRIRRLFERAGLRAYL